MKKRLFFFLIALLTGNLYTQAQEPPAFWEDEFKNEYNREPMHATYFAFETKHLAQQNKRENSKYFLIFDRRTTTIYLLK